MQPLDQDFHRWIRLRIEGPAAEMQEERQAMTKEHENIDTLKV